MHVCAPGGGQIRQTRRVVISQRGNRPRPVHSRCRPGNGVGTIIIAKAKRAGSPRFDSAPLSIPYRIENCDHRRRSGTRQCNIFPSAKTAFGAISRVLCAVLLKVEKFLELHVKRIERDKSRYRYVTSYTYTRERTSRRK